MENYKSTKMKHSTAMKVQKQSNRRITWKATILGIRMKMEKAKSTNKDLQNKK